jgi:LAO/AO transport system kinase
LVLINKADLDEHAATRARAQVLGALRWLGPQQHATTQVLQLSALKGTGLPEFWQAVTAFRQAQQSTGAAAQRRQAQDETWMWQRIDSALRERFRSHAAVRLALPTLLADVRAGRVPASLAARQLLNLTT